MENENENENVEKFAIEIVHELISKFKPSERRMVLLRSDEKIKQYHRDCVEVAEREFDTQVALYEEYLNESARPMEK